MRSCVLTCAMSALLSLAPLGADAQDILRDPTRPYSAVAVTAAATPGSPAAFSVTAIFTSELRRVAVVNGQRVIEGDQVDGATVVEILANSLTLDFRGKQITTRVLPLGFRS